MRSHVFRMREELKALVARFDPDVLPVASAQELVGVFAELERLSAAGKALAARRVAAGNGWQSSGGRSPAEWLAKATGTTVGAAAGTLDTAERLHRLPSVDAALRAGSLSATQADVIAAAAVVDPASEATLVAAAQRDTVKQLKDRCARVKAAARDELAHHAELHRTRHLRTWTDADGAAHVKVKTTPERAAELQALMAPHLRAVFDTARTEGRREAPDAYAHDALFELVRGRGGATGRSRPGYKAVVVIDHTALTRGHTEPGETCEIAGVGPVPVAVAKSLMTDAFLCAVVKEGTDIVNVAHLGRAVTAEQRTALELRDTTCVVPGCDTRTGLEIDHTTSATGWADTGRTTLNELARLCRHHHHQKTYDGWTLTGPPGTWQWRAPPVTAG